MQAALGGRVKCLIPSPNSRVVVYRVDNHVGALDVYTKKVLWPETCYRGMTEFARFAVAWEDDMPSAIGWVDGTDVTVVYREDMKPIVVDLRGYTNSNEGESSTIFRVEFYSLCFSVDGQALFLGDVDGELWKCRRYDDDSITGQPFSRSAPYQHTDIVTCMDLSGTGAVLVTGSLDGRVIVWDMGRMTSTRNLDAHGKVFSVRVAPDGGRIMACTEQFVVSAWEPDCDIMTRHRHLMQEIPKQVLMKPEVFEFIKHGQSDHFDRVVMGVDHIPDFFRGRAFEETSAVAFDGKFVWTGHGKGQVWKIPVSLWRLDEQPGWKANSTAPRQKLSEMFIAVGSCRRVEYPPAPAYSQPESDAPVTAAADDDDDYDDMPELQDDADGGESE